MLEILQHFLRAYYESRISVSGAAFRCPLGPWERLKSVIAFLVNSPSFPSIFPARNSNCRGRFGDTFKTGRKNRPRRVHGKGPPRCGPLWVLRISLEWREFSRTGSYFEFFKPVIP